MTEANTNQLPEGLSLSLKGLTISEGFVRRLNGLVQSITGNTRAKTELTRAKTELTRAQAELAEEKTEQARVQNIASNDAANNAEGAKAAAHQREQEKAQVDPMSGLVDALIGGGGRPSMRGFGL